MMKKLLICALSLLLALSLAACGNASASGNATDAADAGEAQQAANGDGTETAPATVTVTTLNGARESEQIEVPFDPQRIAVMDLAVLDIIDNLGFGDRVVGVSKGSSIDYLQDYVNDDSIINLGTIKEASLEAVMECEPDIIFIGGRLSSSYDAFAEIAPVVFMATDVEAGVVNSVNANAMTVASIFGVQDMVSDLLADFDERIETLAAAAEGKTAFVGMLNSGSFNALGNDGRCSIIGVEVGFENVGVGAVSERSGGGGGDRGGDSAGDEGEAGEDGGSAATSTHGNETSFEYIVQQDPDYIFVMNRDEAIATEGAQTAQEVIENELVQRTSAYENGNIVYLAYSNVWYTAEGGITALDYMLKDLENALLG